MPPDIIKGNSKAELAADNNPGWNAVLAGRLNRACEKDNIRVLYKFCKSQPEMNKLNQWTKEELQKIIHEPKSAGTETGNPPQK